MKALAALSVLGFSAALVACGPQPPAPITTGFGGIAAPKRPEVKSAPFVYTDLDLERTRVSGVGADASGSGIRFITDASGGFSVKADDVWGEVFLLGYRAYAGSSSKDAPAPPPTGAPPCWNATARAFHELARWEGLRLSTRSPKNIEHVRYEGWIDANCVGTASTVETVAAHAIVSGLLYGFRSCTSGCAFSLGDPRREEQLVLLGPRAVWVAASSQPPAESPDHPSPFTTLSVPLSLGSTVSASIHMTRQDIEAFWVPNQPDTQVSLPDPGVDLQIDVELVWSVQALSPTGTVFVGYVPSETTGETYGRSVFTP
ncbi:MAG: hypothetical protein U0271_47865 [Polyangiaceae bacterium]